MGMVSLFLNPEKAEKYSVYQKVPKSKESVYSNRILAVDNLWYR